MSIIYSYSRYLLSAILFLFLISNSFAQTVPTPVITGNTSFCAGTNTTLSTALVSGYTYCWQNTSASTTWQNVGTAGFTAGRSFYQSLAFNGNTPYVAYQDEANGSKTSVMKFDGTNWVYVGNPAFSSGYSAFQNLSFSGNTPYVAFRDWGLNLNGKCTVMKFDGTNWVYVGTPGFTIGGAGFLKFVINAGIPYVAFQDGSNNYEATVMKFNGTNWVNVGNPGFSLGGVNYMSLAFSGNTPYVAYADASNSLQKTTVMKFDGTSWVNVGNAQFTTGATRNQSLALDGTTPYVAFVEDALNYKTSVMKFDGTNWVYVGNPGISAGSSAHLSLAINNNTPYVAYQDDANFYKTTVMKFNGASWVAFGGTGISSGFANYQSLVFNGNTPYVAFADEPTNYKTTVMKYEPGCAGTSNSIQINTPGIYTVTVTNSSGSATSSPVTVTGGAIPAVSCPGNLEVCSNTPVFALTGGSPAGGVYIGPGVNNNQFNPASVGTGIKNITYTYTDPSTGCSNSCGFTITIDATAPVITPLSNNIIIPLNANGTRTITLADVATVVDNCNSNPLHTISPTTFNCSTLGSQTVTVTATDGTFGSSTPSAVSFSQVYGVAFDAAGNMYLADVPNQLIRKISTAGVVTTLAGSGIRSFADGVGTAASFDNPLGIAVDASGNVFVADQGNNRIRKITPTGVVSTFAGSGNASFANGTGTAASFNRPYDIAIDADGNLFVADKDNYKVRKITPSAVVTTIAGSSPGNVDGLGAAAKFDNITGITVDASGNIFVADNGNRQIKKITSSGLVTTLAGSGIIGFSDGTGSSASFSNPWHLTLDPSGNLYITDPNNHAIRKVTQGGVVSTIAGNGTNGSTDGPGISARFSSPFGISADAIGNLFIGDGLNYKIRKITPVYVVSTFAGSGVSGNQNGSIGTSASGNQSTLQIPVTITGQSTPVFSSTQSNVSVIANANCSATLANYASAATATSSCGGAVTISQSPVAGTVLPIGATTVTLTATDASNNTATQTFVVTVTDNAAPVITPLAANTVINLGANGTRTITAADIATVTDCNTSAAVRINPSTFNCTNIGGQTVTVEATDGVFGSPTPGTALFNEPIDVTTDPSGNIFVADRVNNSIRKISPAGFVTTFLTGSTSVKIGNLAADVNGNIYTTDFTNRKIHKITSAGVVSTFAGNGANAIVDGPSLSASFKTPGQIAIDNQGNVYVSDENMIRKISNGNVSFVAGQQAAGYANGSGSSAMFWGMAGLACDANGNIYVADGANNRIRKVTPAGVVSTIAGSGSQGFLDGPAATAAFGFLHAIVLDNSGNIYVGDGDSRRIRKLAGGIVSTIAGNGNTSSVDGDLSTASFGLMTGITMAAGNLVVCEVYTHKIRKVDLSGNVITIAGNGTAGSTNGNVGGITGNYTSLPISVTIADANAPVITPVSNNITIPLNSNGNRTITLADVATVTDNCNNSPSVRISPSAFDCSNIGTQIVTVEATDGSFVAQTPGAVSFYNPVSIASDNNGNFYIADRGSESIRKITPTGDVTLFAGNPASSGGFADGQGTNARFLVVMDLATDAAGNIYIADAGNRRIRKITPGGLVSTIAGNGGTTSVDGIGAAASFESPNAITVDVFGNIYVADASKIRKINPAGNVITVAGSTAGYADGNGLTAKFWGASGLTTDAAGNLYIADGANYRVRKMTPSADVTTLAGGTGQFGFLHAIARDASGDIYLCDNDNYMIKKVSATGIVTSIAGNGTAGANNGTGTAASFNGIYGMTISGGNLYVSEFDNHKIRKVTTAGVVTTFAGSGNQGITNGNIGGITGNYTSSQIQVLVKDVTAPVITAVSNNITFPLNANGTRTITLADIATVTDNCNNNPAVRINPSTFNCSNLGTQTVTVEATDGAFSTPLNPGAVKFNQPNGIVFDNAGNLYIVDRANHLIRKIDVNGNTSTIGGNGTMGFADGIASSSMFKVPIGIAVDAAGNVYVGDDQNHRIRKISPSGIVSTFAGSGVMGSADGTGINAQFNSPAGLAFDNSGNLYVADKYNYKIRKITPTGVVTSIPGFFYIPGDVAVDASGNIYVAEFYSVSRISATGNITLIAGSQSAWGYQDGPAGSALFLAIQGIDIDNNANIFVTDASNNRVRKITNTGQVETIVQAGYPTGIAFSPSGVLYFSDPLTHNIYKINPDNSITNIAGTMGVYGTSNGNVGSNGSGNFSTLQIPVTITGQSIPVFTSTQSNVSLFANNACVVTLANYAANATATALCGGNITITQSPAAGTQINTGTTTVTLTATNSAGLATQSFTVSVTDNTAPSITCPANITTPTTATHPNQTGWATATDNCTAASSIVITYTDNTQGCNINRTWRATDASGNFSTCLQTIAIPQMSVTLGPDMYILYGALGYVGCRTITPVITGGVAPYTYLWTSTQASVNNATTPSVSVCNTTEITHTYTVTVTGATGCVATATVVLHFIDISCSNNGNTTKVSVCLRPQGNASNCHNVCVSENAAPGLVSNGSYYGQCLPGCEVPIQARGTITQSTLIIGGNETPKQVQSKKDVVKVPNLKKLTSVKESEFNVRVYNNPTETYFQLVVESNSAEKITMRIFDVAGRTIENNQTAYAGKIIPIGSSYINGVYFAEIIQGVNRKIVKLIKQ